MDHAWAANRLKLERALGELGAGASEEALKTRYAEMGGKLLADDGTPLTEKPAPTKAPAKAAVKTAVKKIIKKK